VRLGFIRWVSDAPSGGNVYDDALTAALEAMGVKVEVHRVERPAPDGSLADAASQAGLATALEAASSSLVDGIVAIGASELIADAVAAGRSVTILVHHFPADDPALDGQARARTTAMEAEALRAATGILCTSHWAAEELRRRHGLTKIGVAPPGVAPAALAVGSRDRGVPGLLSVGSLTPLKDQLTLVAALRSLTDLAWVAALVGSESVDPAYADRVEEAVAEAGLTDRVRVLGARVGAALEVEWQAADLLVQTSRSETYGIAVLEALARGVPAVVASGSGMVEALAAGRRSLPPAGAVTPPADPDALAARLRRWVTDPDLAATWRSAALDQRGRLPRWTATAAAALAYVIGGKT
jgi:glycosyltransferase involved in cell wall biosynthesis